MQSAEAAPLDPLIGRIQSDWKSVANGGALDALQRDLMELQARDLAPNAAPDRYGKDLVEINTRLYKQNLLPNLELLSVRDGKVLMLDPTRHDKLMALQPGAGAGVGTDAGMMQVVDLTASPAGDRVVYKAPTYQPDALKGPVSPTDVHQGADVPDCKLEARLASLAQADPAAIARMIKDNGNGTYTVTFPGDKQHPVTVSTPTDWERATFSDGMGTGASAGAGAGYNWALIIDKAYRQRTHQPFGPYAAANDVSGLLTGRKEALLVPLATECSMTATAVDWLLSKGDNTAVCKSNLSTEPLAWQVETSAKGAIAAMPADTGKYLQEALNNHMIVNTFVDPDKLKAAKMTGVASATGVVSGDQYATDAQGRRLALLDKHAYSVMSYDAARQTVTLRNPWGKNYDDGGKLVGDGYLTVPMAQFKRMFPAMDVELTGRSR